MPVAVSSKTMTQHMRPGLTVVDLWAQWCAPCRVLSPTLAALESEVPMTVLTLDVATDQAVAKQYHVQSIPTMLLFWQGQPVSKLTGAYPKAKLKAFFEAFIKEHAHE